MLDNLKKLPVIITALATIAGAAVSLNAFHGMIIEEINQDRKEFLLKDGKPLILDAINHVADSIMKKRKISSRTELSTIINSSKEDVWKEIGKLYNSEKNQIKIGMYLDSKLNKIYYIHTNGKRYRAFKDSSKYYYFFNDENKEEWCK